MTTAFDFSTRIRTIMDVRKLFETDKKFTHIGRGRRPLAVGIKKRIILLLLLSMIITFYNNYRCHLIIEFMCFESISFSFFRYHSDYTVRISYYIFETDGFVLIRSSSFELLSLTPKKPSLSRLDAAVRLTSANPFEAVRSRVVVRTSESTRWSKRHCRIRA